MVYFQTKSIHIINSALAPLHIDGEPAESIKNIDIKIQPKSFRLVFPLMRLYSKAEGFFESWHYCF